MDLGGLNKTCIRWGPDPPCEIGNFEGENVICMANGRLKEQDQEFFYSRIQALDKRRTKCISVAGNYDYD